MCISSLLGVCDSLLEGGEGGESPWGLLHLLFTSKNDVIKFHLGTLKTLPPPYFESGLVDS
jgi:hypothetical protein